MTLAQFPEFGFFFRNSQIGVKDRYLKALRFYICEPDPWQKLVIKNLQESKPSKIHEEVLLDTKALDRNKTGNLYRCTGKFFKNLFRLFHMEDHVRIIDKNQKVGPAHIICEFCGRLEAGNQNILQQNLLTTHVLAMVFLFSPVK